MWSLEVLFFKCYPILKLYLFKKKKNKVFLIEKWSICTFGNILLKSCVSIVHVLSHITNKTNFINTK